MLGKLGKILRKLAQPQPLRAIRRAGHYATKPYLAAYAANTDDRVKQDSAEAIGGLWDQIGRLQFDFLVTQGLRPSENMLDIGCGTLRGGRHFIRYLHTGKYTGTDISEGALDGARRVVVDEGLSDKAPTLVLNGEMNLRFSAFADQKFDVLLAQSVFTHLPPPFIEECFAHVGKIMKPTSRFYFTYFMSKKHDRASLETFHQPEAFFADLADSNKLSYTLLRDYKHPRGQHMACVKPKGQG